LALTKQIASCTGSSLKQAGVTSLTGHRGKNGPSLLQKGSSKRPKKGWLGKGGGATRGGEGDWIQRRGNVKAIADLKKESMWDLIQNFKRR